MQTAGRQQGRATDYSLAAGGPDAVARVTAEKMRPNYVADLIVGNRAGASGRLSAKYARAGVGDGITLFFTSDFVMTIFPYRE